MVLAMVQCTDVRTYERIKVTFYVKIIYSTYRRTGIKLKSEKCVCSIWLDTGARVEIGWTPAQELRARNRAAL